MCVCVCVSGEHLMGVSSTLGCKEDDGCVCVCVFFVCEEWWGDAMYLCAMQ